MTGTIYHSEDKHPQDLRRELNPDASQGRNHGLVGKRPEKDNPRTAHDIKEVHQRLKGFTGDLLKRLPVLPEGSRLEQDAVYVDLADPNLTEIRATGDMETEPGHWFVPKSAVDDPLWNRLIGVTDPERTDQVR
jgi:hypothetical protein